MGFFFAPARSHVYDVLPRTERAGWVAHHAVAQSARPDKRVYRITAAGRQALVAWIRDDDPEPEDRAVVLLKLYFGSLVEPELSLARLETVRRRAQALYAHFLELDARNLGNDAEFFPLLTLRHGIERAAATVRWAEEAQARIRARAATPAPV